MFAVLVHEVDDLVIDPEVRRDGAGILDVLLGRAVGEGHFLVHPGPDVSTRHVEARLFQEKRGDSAVDTAGEGYENFFQGKED